MAPSTSLTFPHPELTHIVGTPTNPTIQILQRQLYANALAIHSTRGGGANGHLAILMPAAQYLLRSAVAFNPPVHPGDAPVHPANSTGNQINETNRQYKQDLEDFQIFVNLRTTLKQQLINAIDIDFLRILEDPDFGFTDVTPLAMLEHLKTTYGTISRDDIEANRTKLSVELNVDEPIEVLWVRLQEIQRFAQAANEPITDATAIRLTLPVFEKSGVFGTVTEKWRDKPDAEWTFANFKAHFEKGNKERLRKLTAKTAGYHGANNVTSTVKTDSSNDTLPTTITTDVQSQGTAAAATTLTDDTKSIRTNNNITMYYCWSHGLGKNRAHTSASCNNKREGHQDAATADRIMGGNNRIMERNTNRTSHD
jgi:hypothetical protein